MLIKAQQKFIRTSPRKLRLVADAIKPAVSPQRALVYLEYMDKKAAGPLSKVIKQALANATNNLKLPVDSLSIKEIQIGQGPTYKRGRPRSRGLYHPIAKRTSHITVVLETSPKETSKSEIRNSKLETKKESQNKNV